MSRVDGFLFVHEHHTSGVGSIFDESGKLRFCWGGDCEGNQAELIAKVVLGLTDDLEHAEFAEGELERLKSFKI